MSWRLDKGYSAACARPPQLEYFKMFCFFYVQRYPFVDKELFFPRNFYHQIRLHIVVNIVLVPVVVSYLVCCGLGLFRCWGVLCVN